MTNKKHFSRRPSDIRVRVETWDLKTGDQVRKPRIVDYGSSNERKWLASHLLWAMNNGYSVETMRQRDYEEFLGEGERQKEELRALNDERTQQTADAA